MSVLNFLFRLFFYPLGVLKGIYNLGKDGSRDFYNNRRFHNVIIDSGCAIDENTYISSNCHILKDTLINNSTINSYSYIGSNSIIQNVSIGKFCSIANDVSIGLGQHPTNYFSTSTIFYKRLNTLKISLIEKDLLYEEYKKINIGNDVWIGAKAIIMDGVSIGTGAIVAANAVVTKDVPPYAIVGGVPAKLLKYRFDENKIKMLLASKWWEKDLEKIKEMTLELNRINGSFI